LTSRQNSVYNESIRPHGHKKNKEKSQMKSTGVVRKVDELGRIVLPKPLREIMDIQEKDPLEIFTDNNRIILQKYHPACEFCSNADNVVYFGEKRICRECIDKIKTLF
jgi:transcriptional pleiotropic regulator of transition state genes